MANKRVRCRSAINGRFVTEKYANDNPNITVKETVKKPKVNKPKKR